jgi:hypothetical protein
MGETSVGKKSPDGELDFDLQSRDGSQFVPASSTHISGFAIDAESNSSANFRLTMSFVAADPFTSPLPRSVFTEHVVDNLKIDSRELGG